MVEAREMADLVDDRGVELGRRNVRRVRLAVRENTALAERPVGVVGGVVSSAAVVAVAAAERPEMFPAASKAWTVYT
jgi:hypothetical protein